MLGAGQHRGGEQAAVADVRFPRRADVHDEEDRAREAHGAEDVGERIDRVPRVVGRRTLRQEFRTLSHGAVG